MFSNWRSNNFKMHSSRVENIGIKLQIWPFTCGKQALVRSSQILVSLYTESRNFKFVLDGFTFAPME